MKLSRRLLYDRRDQTRAELFPTRAGHHLWHLRSKSGCTEAQRAIFLAACETLWEAKRQVRAELRQKAVASFQKWAIRRES